MYDTSFIYGVGQRLENVCLTLPKKEVTFAPFWFTMYGFAPLNLREL